MRPVPTPQVLSIIHEFEGKCGTFEASRTYDPSGNPEIGYGHKLSGPEDPLWFATLDQDQADALAMEDVAKAAQGVCNALGPVVMALTDNEYAALICFAFNVGVQAFATSTLCHLVQTGDLEGAGEQFPRWVHEKINGIETIEPGLVRRRAAELALWTQPE